MTEDATLTELERHQLTTAASRAESESKHATSLTDGFVKSVVALAAGVMSLGVSVSAMFPQSRSSWLVGVAWVGLLGTVICGLLLLRKFRDLTTLSYSKHETLYKQAFLSCLKLHDQATQLLEEAKGLATKEDEEFRKYFRYESALLVLFVVSLLLMTVFGIVNLPAWKCG